MTQRVCTVGLWTIILAVTFVGSFRQAAWFGDGREYLLYARAFAAHLSPDIREDDVDRAASIMRHGDPVLERDFRAMGTGRPLGSTARVDTAGFVRAADGRLYTWHFWLYPALVSPFLALTELLRVPPLAAFLLCNWALVLITLGYVAFRWGGMPSQKHLLASLFLLTGTTYYVWWPHPEVFTASLVLLALMAASDRRYGWSMLATALAAAQNPPLIVLLAALALKALFDQGLLGAGARSAGNRPHGSRWTIQVIVGAFAVALAPVAFFWATSRVANPIAAVGAADTSLISVSRLESMFFDLNQGMAIGIPGVALGVAVLTVVGLAQLRDRRNSGGWRVLRPIILGVTLSIIMAVPALAATNWNSGQSAFSRYAYWLSIPITFAVVVSLAALPPRWRVTLGVSIVAVQLVTAAYYGFWGNNARSDHVAFKPAARYVLLRFPELYNPEPEIFIERLRHREGVPDSPTDADSIFRFPETGEPTKILVRESRLADVTTSLRRACRTLSTAPVEGGWVYLNICDDASCLRSKTGSEGEAR
jgi:hypothetical protein